MASLKEIQQTYDWMDEVRRTTMGEFSDITCAFYNGDYTKTLEQAQQAKHEWVLANLNFRPGMRVLDIGSGWGPMLKAVNDRGGEALGLNLSQKQVEACRRHNLQSYLKDWKEVAPGELGTFDAVVSLGAFEHFCSVEEYLAGKQDKIYQAFFQFCYGLLPMGGRLYVQTMVAGKNWPRYEDVSLKAPKASDEYLVALLGKFYPGSWPPLGKEQIVKDAQGFQLILASNGRKDYIETMKEWGVRGQKISLRKLWGIVKLVPRYIANRDFRYQMESLYRAANKTAFEREILDHWRMVFEKV